eukprot:6200712-Pleurochrysis_carterae.AAC.1
MSLLVRRAGTGAAQSDSLSRAHELACAAECEDQWCLGSCDRQELWTDGRYRPYRVSKDGCASASRAISKLSR